MARTVPSDKQQPAPDAGGLVMSPPSWLQRYGHWFACLTLLALIGLYYFDFLIGRAFIWEDLLRQYYPSANYFCTSIAHGRFPFWQPGLLDGIPFYSDLQAGVYYPFTWLLVFFVRDGVLPVPVFQWYIVLHVALGGLLMYAFLKHHRLGAVGCLVGSIIFCFAGFSALHVIHLPMLKVYTWLPLQFLFVDQIATTRRAKYYAFLTLAILMSLLAGFPQALLYDSYFLIGYWLFRRYQTLPAEEKGTWRAAARQLAGESLRIGGVFVSVLLLGAIMLLPSFQHWQKSQRQQWGYAQMAEQSMPPYYLLQFAAPNYLGVANGKEAAVNFWGYNHDRIKPVGQNPGCWQYWEFGGYAGQLALIAALGILLHRRRFRHTPTLFFLVSGGLALWFMLGRFGGLFTVLYRVLPGVAWFRGPARMAGVVDFCLAGLAAFWVHALAAKDAPKVGKSVGILFAAYALVIGSFFLSISWLGSSFTQTPEAGFAEKQGLLSVLLFCGIALCLFGIRTRSALILQRTAMVALVLFVWMDLYVAYGFFHAGETEPWTYYNTNSGMINTYTNLISQVGPIRIAQGVDKHYREILVEPNVPLVHRELEMCQGYVDFVPLHYSILNQITNQEAVLDLENVGLAVGANTAIQQGAVQFRNSCLPRVLFYSSIKAYPTDQAILRDLQSGALNYRQTVAVRTNELQTTFNHAMAAQGQRAIPLQWEPLSPESYQIPYSVRQPGIIFVSENFYPGWEAVDVDGQPLRIIRAFTAFKGIVIPHAGAGIITVRFRPMIFRVGALISGLSAVLLAALYWILARRERNAPLDPPAPLKLAAHEREALAVELPELTEATFDAGI